MMGRRVGGRVVAGRVVEAGWSRPGGRGRVVEWSGGQGRVVEWSGGRGPLHAILCLCMHTMHACMHA